MSSLPVTRFWMTVSETGSKTEQRLPRFPVQSGSWPRSPPSGWAPACSPHRNVLLTSFLLSPDHSPTLLWRGHCPGRLACLVRHLPSLHDFLPIHIPLTWYFSLSSLKFQTLDLWLGPTSWFLLYGNLQYLSSGGIHQPLLLAHTTHHLVDLP